MTHRTPSHPLIAAALLVLLATLGTLQYRWLGDVSEAERERLRASLRTRASEFASELDHELTNMFVTFHVDGERFDADPGGALADAYARVQTSASAPTIVKGVYVLAASGNEPWTLQKLDVDRRTLQSGEWPEALALWHRRAESLPNGPAAPMLLGDTLDSQTPALIIGIPRIRRSSDNGRVRMLSDSASLVRIVIVLLDQDALRHQLVEPLVAKRFGIGDAAQYSVAITRRGNPSQVVYASDPSAAVDLKNADVDMPVFTLRLDEIKSLAANYLPRTTAKNQVSVTIFRRSESANGTHIMTAANTDDGWQLLIRHKAGSLEALVAKSRRRNLAISLGVLALLTGSFVLIIASAQRQQRLARQQMEFVAAVSHELRTPLAVICSAGENLADGIVADQEQVRKYGTLVETEGRRLADMVERVMEFAGIASGGTKRAHAAVDLASVLAEAVAAVEADARRRDIDIRVHANSVPPVAGDVDALRSAMQNIIGNAVKYSPNGEAVDADLTLHNSTVRLRVVDRGIGIDADELPHVFKPFFRGRRAVEAQVRGTGVGLSVVRHVVDAHFGTVEVDSRPGEGTTVTIDLPIASNGPVDGAAPVSHVS